MQRILNAHPEVYGGPEFDLLPDIIALRSRFVRRIESGRIDKFLDGRRLNDVFRSFIIQLFDDKMQREGVRFFSEKTPANVLVFSELADLFPHARFVFVVRDPRATVASMLEVGKKVKTPRFTQDLISAVDHTKRCLERGVSLGSRATVVRYEELVEKGDQQAAWLYSRLGIPDADVSIRDAKYDRSEAGTERGVWFSKEQLEGEVYNTSVEKWRKSLTRAQADYVERVCVVPPVTDHYYKEKRGIPWHFDAGFWSAHFWTLACVASRVLGKRMRS